MGKAAMGGLTSIWKDRGVTLETKVKIVKVLVFSIVLYGAETWTMRKHERRKIDAFELWFWRRVGPTESTVVPVFRGLCDQGTPAVSGQYNDVRGDFQYKLTRDQGTPANADADRHLFVIFAPQPGDSALFILFSITLGRKRYQISLLMRIISLKRISNRLPQLRTPNNNDASRRCASWEK